MWPGSASLPRGYATRSFLRICVLMLIAPFPSVLSVGALGRLLTVGATLVVLPGTGMLTDYWNFIIDFYQ